MTERAAKPSKSEKRQRTEMIYARVSKEEKADFLARADKAGLAAAAFLRAAALKDPGPRAQKRVPADGQALRQILGHLGKTGSNLNQIARYLHTGGSADVVLPDIRAALSDLARIRGLIYEALGKDPDDARAINPMLSADPVPRTDPPPPSGTKSVPPPPDA
ncbi:MAG: plasmid mobilization relaxosome protein MobC [Rhodospirillaceae bacterium]